MSSVNPTLFSKDLNLLLRKLRLKMYWTSRGSISSETSSLPMFRAKSAFNPGVDPAVEQELQLWAKGLRDRAEQQAQRTASPSSSPLPYLVRAALRWLKQQHHDRQS